MSDLLSSLPVDLLTDVLLPLLDCRALTSLEATCSAWHDFLNSDECSIVWKTKVQQHFNFPANATGRRTGYKQLYTRLVGGESAFVWGQNDSGRLGIAPDDHSLRPWLIQRGLPVPALIELPRPPIALCAAGWSCHALSTSGELMSWGTLDASSGFPRPGAPLHQAWRTIHQPMLHPCNAEMGPIVEMQAGRKHLLLRTTAGDVWEIRSIGRAMRVSDVDQRWGTKANGALGGPETKVVRVEAAWEHSIALTASGSAYIWWEPGLDPIVAAAAEAGETTLTDSSTQGVVFDFSVDSVRLPPLPDQQQLESFASGDHFVIALSKPDARLYYLDVSPVPDPQRPLAPHRGTEPDDSPVRGRQSRARLDAAFLSGRREWKRMQRFDDIKEVSQLPFFEERGWTLDESMRITHVTAHFKHFSVYCVPANDNLRASVVLQGTDEWTEHSSPTIIPELQGRGVIQIAQGDYHNLALTSAGELLAWGAYSAGALGLGHPQLSNTPLSALPEPQANADTNQERRHPADTSYRFPGFARPRPAARIPDPPERIEHPMVVRFPGDPEPPAQSELGSAGPGTTTKRSTGKFVFAITASGWHSGALAVDLSAGERAEADMTKSADGPRIRLRDVSRIEDINRPGGGGEWNAGRGGEYEMPAGNPAPGDQRGQGNLFRGVFRVGFAGRGRTQPGSRGPDR